MPGRPVSRNRNGLTPGSGPRGHPLVARNSAEKCWIKISLQGEGCPGLVEQAGLPADSAELDLAPRGHILRVPALHPEDMLRYSCLDRCGKAEPGGNRRRVEAHLPRPSTIMRDWSLDEDGLSITSRTLSRRSREHGGQTRDGPTALPLAGRPTTGP